VSEGGGGNRTKGTEAEKKRRREGEKKKDVLSDKSHPDPRGEGVGNFFLVKEGKGGKTKKGEEEILDRGIWGGGVLSSRSIWDKIS